MNGEKAMYDFHLAKELAQGADIAIQEQMKKVQAAIALMAVDTRRGTQGAKDAIHLHAAYAHLTAASAELIEVWPL